MFVFFFSHTPSTSEYTANCSPFTYPMEQSADRRSAAQLCSIWQSHCSHVNNALDDHLCLDCCVPRYRDLLEDQDDEDPSERGHALVSSPETWRTQLAKWIGDARAAEHADDLVNANSNSEASDDDNITPRIPNRLPAWKPMTLQVLFGGAEKPRGRRMSAQMMDEEERLMQAGRRGGGCNSRRWSDRNQFGRRVLRLDYSSVVWCGKFDFKTLNCPLI
ncbi:hypothetical protein C8R45DRAFT_922854 [Mycena sanguinolenta]|nr:hypothetical protein C8R45DRAFT_922854 [Mycena sanguinolenta]